MEYTIRLAKPTDVDAIRELNRSIFSSDLEFITDLNQAWPDSAAGEAYFKQLVTGPDPVGFVAEVKNQVVGYIAIGSKKRNGRNKTYAEVQNMAVACNYQSKGIGTKLLAQAENWAQEKGIDRLLVGAAAKNPRSTKFYREFGFADTEIFLEKEI